MRAWTRAYGVMLGHQWPEAAPESFASDYDVSRLDDPEQQPLPPDIAEQVRKYAENSVAEVKRNVFPSHGLLGLA